MYSDYLFSCQAHHSFKYLLVLLTVLWVRTSGRSCMEIWSLLNRLCGCWSWRVHFWHGLFTDMLMPQYCVYQCPSLFFSPSGSSCFRFSPCDLGFSQHGCLKCSWLTQQLASKTVCSKRDGEKMPVQLQSEFRTGTVLLPCIPLFRIIWFKEVEKKGLLLLRGMAWAQCIWLCRMEDTIFAILKKVH